MPETTEYRDVVDIAFRESYSLVLASVSRQVRDIDQHASAENPDDTDWIEIRRLFDELALIHPSPVVRLNRAVAAGFADGPESGMAALNELSDQLSSYPSYHTARAEMMERIGDREGAIDAIGTALALVDNDVEKRFLERRLSIMQG